MEGKEIEKSMGKKPKLEVRPHFRNLDMPWCEQIRFPFIFSRDYSIPLKKDKGLPVF